MLHGAFRRRTESRRYRKQQQECVLNHFVCLAGIPQSRFDCKGGMITQKCACARFPGLVHKVCAPQFLPAMEYTFQGEAYWKIVLHALKFPHKQVHGVLLGKHTPAAVDVVDALPLFHSAPLAPLLEAAFVQVINVCFFSIRTDNSVCLDGRRRKSMRARSSSLS